LGAPLADFLLEPHRNYLPVLEAALKADLPKGLAHITGGGFIDNIPRILPEGCGGVVRKASWKVPALFTLIQTLGEIDPDEMYQVFNMGVGMVAVVAPEKLADFQAAIAEPTWVIGEVVAGDGVALE
jgi:phosphoribosylaminoimidazole (AIR) synthetase